MVHFLVYLCDKFLTVNNFIEKLLEIYSEKRKMGINSVQVAKVQLESQCRIDLAKISKYEKLGEASGEKAPIIAPGA